MHLYRQNKNPWSFWKAPGVLIPFVESSELAREDSKHLELRERHGDGNKFIAYPIALLIIHKRFHGNPR